MCCTETDTLYFPFLPGLTAFDSTFYVSAIAGNGLAGDSIDRADPCLDVSNPQPVRWLAKPTISAVSTGHELCANGGCMTVDFVFTGHPPFAFAWVLEQGGQVLYSRSEVAGGCGIWNAECGMAELLVFSDSLAHNSKQPKARPFRIPYSAFPIPHSPSGNPAAHPCVNQPFSFNPTNLHTCFS